MSGTTESSTFPRTKIHPTAVIEDGVEIGEGTTIGPYCVLRGPLRIGANCYLSSHVCVGEVAEHGVERYEFRGRPSGRIEIGDGVVLREFVTVTSPIETCTRIGDNCYLQARSYIGHDVTLGDGVVLASAAILGGWCWVGTGAYLGFGAVVHQFSTIGSYAMLAANAFVGKDVPPLGIYIPGKALKSNWPYVSRKFSLADEDEAAIVAREGERWDTARAISEHRSGRARPHLAPPPATPTT